MNDRTTKVHANDRRDDETVSSGVLGRATSAIDQGRDAAADAARRGAAGIEANPLGILVGGLAVGVLAGALLPRSAREKELLAPVGQRLGETARAAIAAAREAGQSELEQRGLTRDAARDQVRGLFDGVGKALASAGSAAVHTAGANARGGDND